MSAELGYAIALVGVILIAILAFILTKLDWEMVKELRKSARKVKLQKQRTKLRLKQDTLQQQKKTIQDELEELEGE